MSKICNILFAAGGTGGHLYPAIAVADKIMELKPNANILFVGTKTKLESTAVPKAGYSFKPIWISGVSRQLTLKNLLFPLKLLVALIQSVVIVLTFKPNAMVGAGAYVSGPIGFISSIFGAKIILLEQNSFPGITNRILENRASSIHISFKDSEKYFKNKAKLNFSGNPVRSNLKLIDKATAKQKLSLNPNKKTLFVFGGSLGAYSLNEAVEKNLNKFLEHDIQIIWQTGKAYFNKYKNSKDENVLIIPFIDDMALAYSACDLLVVRAGATTIAEVSILGLPVIFVPSPNVAADHQYLNAKSIEEKSACILIKDNEVISQLGEKVVELINNKTLLSDLSKNIKAFAKPNASLSVANDVLRLANC